MSDAEFDEAFHGVSQKLRNNRGESVRVAVAKLAAHQLGFEDKCALNHQRFLGLKTLEHLDLAAAFAPQTHRSRQEFSRRVADDKDDGATVENLNGVARDMQCG